MKYWLFALVGLMTLASPAVAQTSVRYTLTGTNNGTAFSLSGLRGATATAGVSVFVNPIDVTFGAQSGTITNSGRFFVNGDIAGFSYSGGNDFLDFRSPSFNTYSVNSNNSLGPINPNLLFGVNNVATSFGTASFGNATNLVFSAVASAPAVPEPATWGLMISGFGAVGGALRRRRRLGVTGSLAVG
ncbi:MAG: PEPxxWA-CTERM sorting domain-containing protein [Pseudomonadota bacterium]